MIDYMKKRKKHGKEKILLLTLTSFTLLFSEESVSAKVIYDLTTKNIPSFEMRILSAIAANKTHYKSLYAN